MRITILILFGFLIHHPQALFSQEYNYKQETVNFLGDTIQLTIDPSMLIEYTEPVSEQSLNAFYSKVNLSDFHSLINKLLLYRDQHKMSDWLYYQLIRRTAEMISPKANNYERYTLYKWFLLTKSGYDAHLALEKNQLLFYVRSDDNIYDIPLFMLNGKQYVCLNFHDFDSRSIDRDKIYTANIDVPEATRSFSYKIDRLPAFNTGNYDSKEIDFLYGDKLYRYHLVLNQQVEKVFTNYPVVDFELYFNIPISNKTYTSLIPALKKDVLKMSQKNGVEYLMRFTRDAFSFQNDVEQFGKEKRLTPEQTLLYGKSDCDDRTALFFYLVKEIYNLPMIVLLYPEHVTIAVKLDKPVGEPIHYMDQKFTVCETTPQGIDLGLGQLPPGLKNKDYKVVYEYDPFVNLAAH